MMSTNVKITLDKAAVKARVQTTTQKITEIIANELLKDANYYCREDNSDLIKSSITASKPERGDLVWNRPYAKKVYYTGNPSTDVNPNASTMWAHKAVAENNNKYQRMAQKIVKSEV